MKSSLNKKIHIHTLDEEEVAGDSAYAKELLNIQTWYNQEDQKLKNMLAQKRSQALTNYQKRAATKNTTSIQKSTPSQNQTKQTGTVTTSGQPVNAQGNTPAVESVSIDILRVKEINEENERYSSYDPKDNRNWYQRPENKAGYKPPRAEKSKSKKKLGVKAKRRLEDLCDMINDIKSDIKSEREKYSSPNYPGIRGEIEDFFGEIGTEASNLINSGLSDKEKLDGLVDLGIKDPKETLDTYHYYYPEYDESTKDERIKSKKTIERLESELRSLESELEEIEDTYDDIEVDDIIRYYLNESTYSTTGVDRYDLQNLKDYLDSESISYMEEEGGDVLDFDETELHREWQNRLSEIGLKEIVPGETDDILTIESEDNESEDEDIIDIDNKIDEEKVFYVKIDHEGEEFIGKIYKLFDEGDWRSKLVDGESETFEELNYDPEWDEFDIIAFLRENYADAELIDEDEFNGHVEEPEAEPEKTNESASYPIITVKTRTGLVKYSISDIAEMIDDPEYYSADNLFSWIAVADMKTRNRRNINIPRVKAYLRKIVTDNRSKFIDVSNDHLNLNENINEARIVKNAEDFEYRLQTNNWKWNKEEFNMLASFVRDMDKKYGKDNHSYGRESRLAFIYPNFYSKLNESTHRIPTFDEYLK